MSLTIMRICFFFQEPNKAVQKEKMKTEHKMSLKELESLEEFPFEIDESATQVIEGLCPICQQKLVRYIDNKSLFDGLLTFHIIKLMCLQCKKEFLDLEEAKKHDLFLALERMGKNKIFSLVAERKMKPLYA